MPESNWAISYTGAQKTLSRQLVPACPLAHALRDLIGWLLWQALCWLCVFECPSPGICCLVSSLCPHTHTGTSTHRRAHILQKHISVRRNSANKQDPHTQLSYSSIYTSYMHLYISGCVYLCCGHIITYSQAWLMATCHSGALSHCGETKHSEALIHRSRRYNAMTIAAKAAANPLSVTPMTPAQ